MLAILGSDSLAKVAISPDLCNLGVASNFGQFSFVSRNMALNVNLQQHPGHMQRIVGPAGGVLLSTADLMNNEGDNSFSEDKVLAGLCLSVKHSSTSKHVEKITRMQGFGSGRNNKRVKIGTSWDRMYVFADLRHPGKCFVIMLESTSKVRNVFELNSGNVIVGSPFYILEPTPTTDRRLLGSMPIIETMHKLVPIVFSLEAVPISTVVPSTNITRNIVKGDQYYFTCHNVNDVALNLFHLTNQGCCKGVECDKAVFMDSDKNEFCGCLYSHSMFGNMVAEMDVTFPNPFPKEIDASPTLSVQRFRSLRTTKLFFENYPSFTRVYEEANHHYALRTSIRDIVTYINTHGGWTIVGWFRKGEITDASNESERVENLTINVHLSLLIPTRQDLWEEDEFHGKLVTVKED